MWCSGFEHHNYVCIHIHFALRLLVILCTVAINRLYSFLVVILFFFAFNVVCTSNVLCREQQRHWPHTLQTVCWLTIYYFNHKMSVYNSPHSIVSAPPAVKSIRIWTIKIWNCIGSRILNAHYYETGNFVICCIILWVFFLSSFLVIALIKLSPNMVTKLSLKNAHNDHHRSINREFVAWIFFMSFRYAYAFHTQTLVYYMDV